ncbi:MAG: hypothetical protein IAI50_04550 [Candidatus Eremiobacteraeota bacterium]|nr:hypothetical protein [Candidatus Eremiobacteraeota bacterium]
MADSAATLFDRVSVDARASFDERLRGFAAEVAKRHRHGRGDLNAMLVALRGWHRTWAVCLPGRVPPLDDELVALAISAYRSAAGGRKRTAA